MNARRTAGAPLDVHLTAEGISKALGGHRSGATWMARCPAHDDRTPSLSIANAGENKVLVRCHAGCGQERVIAALRGRGLWGASCSRSLLLMPRRKPVEHEPDRDDTRRTAMALAVWESSMPMPGTPVAAYLASRGIHLQPTDALRFHPSLKHSLGGFWPAMVALVVHGETGQALAVHRTFLARDGHGKAPVDSPKMMLGPCRGGVVRLGEPGDVLMVGEGIETCLAATQATGNPAWAALSTAGLRSLDLPRSIQDVIVLADGDDAGEAAAQDCAHRWTREGRRVRIARPPRGTDFNDLLMRRAPRIVEACHE